MCNCTGSQCIVVVLSLSPDRREREDETLAHRAAGIHRAYYRSWHRPARYPTV